ncbi:MAG: hypothetical protein A49_31830 [Methyloceanibacter sp.]|nr:MAG: hypothetical protein A49_31830 [Methyloceanibacter sp.]
MVAPLVMLKPCEGVVRAERHAPALIERPLFVKGEWHDYDGDSIYLDWTVDLGCKDPNTGAFLPVAVPLRSHLAGVSFIDVTDPNSPVTRYFHNNHLGTTMALSDASGTRTDLFFYGAFGVQVGHTGSTETRYGYVGAQGYQTDSSTGLMHLGARYYDPVIGRFLQRDPIGTAGSLNVYAYTENAPIGALDPDGLDRWYFDNGPFGHSYVIFENPDSRGPIENYKKVDFANYTNHWPQGYLAITTGGPTAPTGGRRIPSTPSQDRAALKELQRLEDPKNTPWYNTILFNCNHFAAFAKDLGLPKPPIMPPGYGVCFPAGTSIKGKTGMQAIEDLAVGAEVQTYNPVTKSPGYGTVEKVHKSYAQSFVRVEADGETIICTPEHPFWSPGCGWVCARDLVVGQPLFAFGGRQFVIDATSTIQIPHAISVYNITASGDHTFFVGRHGFLVHNKYIP